MVFGRFSLWYLADFHYGIWPIFIMVFGRFSLWYLADFHYGIWPIFDSRLP